jgi:hypothetical protein
MEVEMWRTLGDLFAIKLSSSNRRTSGLGKLAKLGVASHLSSGRGLTGKAANASIALSAARMGLGALVMGSVVAAAVAALRGSRRSARSSDPSYS